MAAGVFLGVLGVFGVLGATTLRPLSETEQIDESRSIFRGRVEQIAAARETTPSGGVAIVTTVRVAPLAVYKGDVAAPVALRFLGGRVGDVEMRVDGMPEFEVGREYILFVSAAGNRACPVVGWSHGSLRVDRTTNPAGDIAEPAAVEAPKVDARADAKTKTTATDAAQAPPRARRMLPGARTLPEFERRLRERIAERRKAAAS